MIVVRPVEDRDLEGLLALAASTGTGLTTLPHDADALKYKIEQSNLAFDSMTPLDGKHAYLFVLEDCENGVIAGTSAIVAGVGLDRPFYSYRLLHLTQVSTEPQMRTDMELLQLSNDYVGATEVATLFLSEAYRRDQLGKLLSKARYLFMAAHLDRFSDKVISEIRGWVDEKGNSPFWEAIGRHFFGMDFKTADEINGMGNSQFIADLMPKFPIYTALLSREARDVIGTPHESATPAIRLLEKEGFRFSGAVDIFDAGPALEAHKRGIYTVRKSERRSFAGAIEGSVSKADHLVSNESLKDFRVVLSNVADTDSGLWLPEESAVALRIKRDDVAFVAPLHIEE
ncbi:arginine N-succinyltransferase [Temperatibacter marinus]|uniref:Arginine N-succinyltransferase n=1 Tax=Temperatibacter marinus TaxID=1456591 RepID=A0AA52H850_9PROT|nr:arginine N-succinyltransferase [Temperatibacter marinus]WND01464.1 arginine N-succinyltransferase [Temperatibacter marinus]